MEDYVEVKPIVNKTLCTIRVSRTLFDQSPEVILRAIVSETIDLISEVMVAS